MRKLVFMIPAILLLLSLLFLSVRSKSVSKQKIYVPPEEYVPNEVLVKFKKDISKNFIQEAINSVQGKVITYLGKKIVASQWDPALSSLRSFRLDPDLLHIKVPETIGTEQAISILNKLPIVEYAEKNGIIHLYTEPNDTYFYKLWGLHNEGRENQGGGTEDADIDAPEAWGIFTGSSDIVVAVIDTGVDYGHVDLAANIWKNEDEIYDGIDNDNNGYTDDVVGWDFVNNYIYPMDDYNPYYHGTHVAGTIGAVGNNGEGVTGVNWNVKIMVLKAGNSEGEFYTDDCIHAIDYATDNGAHLSNNSWGSYTHYQSLYNAISRAKWHRKLFIAAAGNDGYPYAAYPARYDLENIISVAATDNNDNKAEYSNYGSTSVDLGAPGGSGYPYYTDNIKEDIYSTKYHNDYQYLYGTSMAAPHVAGVAALVWGKLPLLKWDQVKDIIMERVDPLPSLSGKTVTGGRLNAYNAIYDPSPPSASPSNLNAVLGGTSYQIDLSWQDNSDNELVFEIQRKKAGVCKFTTVGSARENVTSYQDKTCTIGVTYYYRVRACNFAGNSAFSNTASATIPTGSPAAPTNLTAREEFDFNAGIWRVKLTWQDNSNNEKGFKIERKVFDYEDWWEIDQVEGNVTTIYDDDPFCNEGMAYRVRAYNVYGNSSYSNEATALVWCGGELYCRIWFEPGRNPDNDIADSKELIIYYY